MKKITILIPVILFIIFSCNNEKPQNELLTNIKKKEKSIDEAISNKTVKRDQVRSLLRMYDKAYMENPKDTAMASYLMKGGEIALHYNLFKRSINFFDAVEISFPNTKHYPMAVFMKAFVYEELKDSAMARAYYEKFIKENPDHELVDDAQISIENLGKSLEEIVQEFENQKSPEEKKAKEEKKKKKIDGGF